MPVRRRRESEGRDRDLVPTFSYCCRPSQGCFFFDGGVSSPAAFPSWFTKRLLNRRVRVRCYARDQYGRIVGTVQYGIRRRDLSTELLRKGLASVYRSAGAVYAQRPLSGWDAIEARAQRNRLGMWQRGGSAAMLPGEFKARQRKRKAKS